MRLVDQRECVVVAPAALADDRALTYEARRRHELEALRVRGVRFVVTGSELTHITERFADAGYRDRVRRELRCRGERPLVERRCVDVRVLRARGVSRRDRVAPGLVEDTGLEEMQREQGCQVLRVADSGLERYAD